MKYNQGMNKYSDISECPSRVNKETDQSVLLEQPSFPPMRDFEFLGQLMLDLQEMPLVEPTNSLLKKMLTNGIDGLLLPITNLPGVHECTILSSTLTTLACEIVTHQLSHPIEEDVRSLHVRLIKEKHSHFTNIVFGVVGNCRGTTRLLQTLVESCLGASVQREF